MIPVVSHLDYERIAFELARNHCGPKLDVETLILDIGISAEQFALLVGDTLFQSLVRKYTKELTESGVSFQMKARLLAEDLLGANYRLAKHKDTPPSVAVTAIANTVRWAGLEKKPGEDIDLDRMPKISISINLGNDTASKVVTIDATPLSEEIPPPAAPAYRITEAEGESQ